MKTTLIILVVLVVIVTWSQVGKAEYSCDNWKNSEEIGRCDGCVFPAGDMAGKCKRTGKFYDEVTCSVAGGIWCKSADRL